MLLVAVLSMCALATAEVLTLVTRQSHYGPTLSRAGEGLAWLFIGLMLLLRLAVVAQSVAVFFIWKGTLKPNGKAKVHTI